MTAESSKKVLLVGHSGVGKTTFIKKLRTGNFDQKWFSTLGVEVHPITTNKNKFYVWDCAGKECLAGDVSSYYEGANACIIMCDTQSKASLVSAEKYAKEIIDYFGSLPIVFVCNKKDLQPGYNDLPKGAIFISTKTENFHELLRPFVKLDKMLV
jgi:small GTP-binding protein